MEDESKEIIEYDRCFGKRRVIILGDTGVGKTSLLNNLLRLPDCYDTVPTDGVATKCCHLTSDYLTWIPPGNKHSSTSEKLPVILTSSTEDIEKEKSIPLPVSSSNPEEICEKTEEDTSTPPPTVLQRNVERLKSKESSTECHDLCMSVCVVTFYLFLGLLNYGVGALFLSVLFTFKLILLALSRETCCQCVPQILDATLFLAFSNALLTLISLEIDHAAELNRMFVPKFIMLGVCITASQCHFRFGIILALSLFQFPDGSCHGNFTYFAFETVCSLLNGYGDVNYKNLCYIFITCLCITLFMLLIRCSTINLKIITLINATCLCLLTLVSYLKFLRTCCIFILANISLTFMSILSINIASIYGTKSQVFDLKSHFIGTIVGVFSAYVFGMENIASGSGNIKSYIEICLNIAMALCLYWSPTMKIETNVENNITKHWTVPDIHIPSTLGNTKRNTETETDYFELKVLEFPGTVQFENIYHDFITRAHVYMFLFKLQRNITEPLQQWDILYKRLNALKTQGIFDRHVSFLFVGTHKSEVTQPYIDSLSNIIKQEIESGCLGLLHSKNISEQILYAMDNDDKDAKQFDDIRRGIWSRLLLQDRAESIQMGYTNLRGMSVTLPKDIDEGSTHHLTQRQSSSDGDLLTTIANLFTDTNMVEEHGLLKWIGEARLREICGSNSSNVLKTLQNLDLIVHKPMEKQCLVPSLLPLYAGNPSDIWSQEKGDDVFYIEFSSGFHKAVFHLIELYLVEEIGTSKLPYVFSNIAYFCVEGQMELLLELNTVKEMKNLVRISIRTSSKCHLKLLHLILNRLTKICKQIFKHITYTFGIACPKVELHDVRHHDFHLLQFASCDVSLPDDIDATISNECCNRIHVWCARDNTVKSVLNPGTLIFKHWPIEVVRIVCTALDRDKPDYKNWMGLVGALDFTVDFVDSVNRKDNPTKQVLEHWNMTSPIPITLRDLIRFLEEPPMERKDIVRDIYDYLDKL